MHGMHGAYESDFVHLRGVDYPQDSKTPGTMGGGICPGSATENRHPGDCVDTHRGCGLGRTRSTGYCELTLPVS